MAEPESKKERIFQDAQGKLKSLKLSERLQAARDVDVSHGGAAGAKHVLKTMVEERTNLTELAASAKKDQAPSASWAAVAAAIAAASPTTSETKEGQKEVGNGAAQSTQLEAKAPSESTLAEIDVLDTDDNLDFTNPAYADARAISLITTPDPILGKE
jgi:hypothetical protein